MRAITFSWEGGPLDIYRTACLCSHIAHGFPVELKTEDPPHQVPSGVIVHRLKEINHEEQLNRHLSLSTQDGINNHNAIEIDQLRLSPESNPRQSTLHHLAWIEAFKLWLPEFRSEMRECIRGLHLAPLHLSFASLAGIDLNCLPPAGSFMDELTSRYIPADPSAPVPRLCSQEVRQAIHSFFQWQPLWSKEMIAKRCHDGILHDLKLIGWPTRIKRKARRMLIGLPDLSRISPA